MIKVNPNSRDPREDKFGIRLTDKGKQYIKYTVGVSAMETPFFWAAHLYTKWTGKYEANGWTRPYAFAIGISTIVYLLIGFYFLITVLARYYEKHIVALVILTLAFATNVFFHATHVTMAHGFLFFDYCVLIYLTMRYHEKPSLLLALGMISFRSGRPGTEIDGTKLLSICKFPKENWVIRSRYLC